MTTNNDTLGSDDIPFPRVQGPSSGFSISPAASPGSITPHGSPGQSSPALGPESAKPSSEALTNSSSKESKLTSSDKLSALPRPASPPWRPRVFRRSLDASTSSSMSHSMPVFPQAGNTNSDVQADASFTSLPANSKNLSPPTHHGTLPRNSASDSSVGKDTPKQRISFESDRISLPTFHNVRQAFSRAGRGSDQASSPARRPQDARSSSLKQKELPSDSPNVLSSRSPSHSRSRAASPLRFLHNWSAQWRAMHHREEPFIPVDPFKTRWKFNLADSIASCLCFWRHHPTDEEVGVTHESRYSVESRPAGLVDYSCADTLPECFPPRSKVETGLRNTREFLTEALPHILYLYFLLRLPAIYFSRVARIFRDAEVSQPDIHRMCEGGLMGSGFVPHTDLAGGPAAAEAARRTAEPLSGGGALASGLGFTAHIGAAAAAVPIPLPYPDEWSPPLVSPALVRFKNSWEAFIDSLLREWKTLNLVSALLLSAIMTMFQVPDAAYDPITRTAALISMVCALMSLTYGCVYIVRFGTMRSMYRASRWAEEARKSYTLIWWNAWTLLAMPAVWLAWSMISFIICILSFVWRTGSTEDPHERGPMTPRTILGPRIAITVILFLGLLYFVLIIQSLKSYGSRTRDVDRPGVYAMGARTGVEGDRREERERRGDETERRGRERQRSQRRHHHRHRSEREHREARGDEAPAPGHSGQATPAVGSDSEEKRPLGDVLGLGLLGLDDLKDAGDPTKSKGSVDVRVEEK